MNLTFNRMIKNVSAVAGLLTGVSKHVDYKRLNGYIIAMAEVNDVAGIMEEASRCLKEILDYRLFAVAVSEGSRMDLWIDPAMYKKSMERMIKSDFNCDDDIKFNYINGGDNDPEGQVEYNFKNMLSFEHIEKAYSARFYIAPQRKMLAYHREIIQTVVRSMAVALENVISIKQLKDVASIDPLTGAYNRREFDLRFANQVENSKRYGTEFSIFMFDIDFFKKVNDIYGHQAGDEVLKKLSATVKDSIRAGDTLSRYGGEEFIVMLPLASKIKSMELADRLRKKIENMVILHGDDKIKVTASFGVASYSAGQTCNSIIEKADALLYKAKANGRNIVMPGLMKLCPLKDQQVL